MVVIRARSVDYYGFVISCECPGMTDAAGKDCQAEDCQCGYDGVLMQCRSGFVVVPVWNPGPVILYGVFLFPVQDSVDDRVDVLFLFVWVHGEVRVASEHGGELGLVPVVEDVARLAVRFRICQFVTDSERRAGAFSDQKVAFKEPRGVLIVDFLVLLAFFKDIQFRVADVLGEYDVCPLDVFYHASVKVCIHPSAPDRSGEIYLLHFLVYFMSGSSFRPDMCVPAPMQR